jgi:hypothetical protein
MAKLIDSDNPMRVTIDAVQILGHEKGTRPGVGEVRELFTRERPGTPFFRAAAARTPLAQHRPARSDSKSTIFPPPSANVW